MSGEGEYPKEDGDVLYGKEANMAYYNGAFGNTLNYSNVSITTSATVIKASNSNRKSILIYNNDTTSIFIGDSGVTINDGFELAPLESIYLVDTEAFYGIVSAGTADIRYLEVE